MRVMIDIDESKIDELKNCGVPVYVMGTEKDYFLYCVFGRDDIVENSNPP